MMKSPKKDIPYLSYLEKRVPILAIVLDILEYRVIISRMNPLKTDMSFCYSEFRATLIRQTSPITL